MVERMGGMSKPGCTEGSEHQEEQGTCTRQPTTHSDNASRGDCHTLSEAHGYTTF